MAGRNMGVIPISISILVSFLSAITYIADPVEVYTRGSGYWGMILGYMTAIIFAVHFIIPIFHKARVISTYEVSIVTFFIVGR